MPDVILSITAHTQTFEYRVFNRNSSALKITNAKLISLSADPFSDDNNEICVNGELLLDANTGVKFWRGTENEPEAIAISFPNNDGELIGELVSATNGTININASNTIILNPMDDICKGAIPNRIPIWGDGAIGNLRTVGSVSNRQPSDLLNGQVQISARAVESLFKVPTGVEGLYEAGTVSLPLGTRLESDGFYSQTDQNQSGKWVGLARPVSINGTHSFQVDISTDEQRVWLFRSGVRDAGIADPIGASAFVSQTKDPGVIRTQVFIAIVFLIMQTVATLVQTIDVSAPHSSKLKRPRPAKKPVEELQADD